ncbi:MAG TPA: zf-HC2 domain-containing protein [Streptosporangiaceae bacterium]|jgi:anti-sigma factor RsiW
MSGLACQDVRLALGVYVVGAIDPAERAIVDIHLSHCPECREELAGLAGLPSLLGRVPLADAERLTMADAEVRDLEEPPDEMLGSLLDQVAGRRRRSRLRGVLSLAAAAVIAVGAGVAGGVAATGGLGQPKVAASHGGWPDRVQATDHQTHVTASVSYGPVPSGTGTMVYVRGIPPGTVCKFWAVSSDGRRWPVTMWRVVHADIGYSSTVPMPAGSVAGFQITAGGKMLISIKTS